MNRAISVTQLENAKFDIMPFTGVWKDHLGTPEISGAWIIWGHSANGKTRYCLQLAKYLCKFENVLYDSLEEGNSASLQKAVIECGMSEVAGRFKILDREPIEDLKVRLRKHKSARIIFIDSFQYTFLDKKAYKELLAEFHGKKLFIFVSHAEGRHPEGKAAKSVRYDAGIKTRVEGFKAFAQSRYGGNGEYIIWPEGAKKYWG